MRVLIATFGERGHVTPFLAAAARLDRLGHEVGWLTVPALDPDEPGSGALRAVIERTGARALDLDGDIDVPDATEGDIHMMRTDRRRLTHNWMRITIADQSQFGLVPSIGCLLEAFRPRVAIIDPLVWAFSIALGRAKVPYLSAPTNLEYLLPPELIETVGAWGFDLELLPAWRKAREQCFAQHGLRPEFGVHSPLSPWHNASFTTAEFIGENGRNPAVAELVGAGLLPEWARGHARAFDWHRLDADRKLVVVSFGSQVYWQPERFRLVAEAAAELPVQLVVGCSALADTGFASTLPGDPIVVPWLPQRQLLERAHAFVTHGGGNSVAEAHWAGVPMLVLPIDIDQPIQAYLVDRSRAGVWLRDPNGPDAVERCRRALSALIDEDSSYRTRAAAISRSYMRSDGARRVVEVALGLAWNNSRP